MLNTVFDLSVNAGSAFKKVGPIPPGWSIDGVSFAVTGDESQSIKVGVSLFKDTNPAEDSTAFASGDKPARTTDGMVEASPIVITYDFNSPIVFPVRNSDYRYALVACTAAGLANVIASVFLSKGEDNGRRQAG